MNNAYMFDRIKKRKFNIPPGRAPGEADAFVMDDTQISEVDNAAFERFMGLLKEYSDNPKRKNVKELSDFLKENHILKLIDRTSEEIHFFDRQIDLIKLLDFAYDRAINSKDINIVKLGISLLGMMNLAGRDDCKKAIMALGENEEFTLYSLYAISEWDDAVEIAQKYANTLKGWGKTYAETWLEPEVY